MTGVRAACRAMSDDLVSWRRYLHAHPELSFAEHATAAWIQDRLLEMGLAPDNPTGTSLVVQIVGDRPGPSVAIRADIDALPIHEANDFTFASQHPGVMHACGHDGHTAIALGVARLLAADRAFPGMVKIIFQSGEEMPPGGARALVEAEVLAGVDVIIGLHLISDIPTGRAGIRPGPQMANSDSFRAVIRGKGGHGASPHDTIDSIVVAASAVMNLQTIVSRKVDPVDPAVVTVGSLRGGSAYNIIAPEVELLGTARSFRAGVRQLLHDEIDRTLQATCAAYGATYELEYIWGYPALVNHPRESELFALVCRSVLGDNGLLPELRPVMGGEDFAYYLEQRPGAFLFLGCRNPDVGASWPHHHPRFTIDEAALPLGVEILCRMAHELLAPGP